MKFKEIKIYMLAFLLLTISFSVYGKEDKKDKQLNKQNTVYKTQGDKTGKVGDSYRLNINNINIPLNRIGVIADVAIDDNGNGTVETNLGEGSKAAYGGHHFLFSSGFFLSGFANGNLFANAVASASLVNDYVQGVVTPDHNGASDPRAQMYVLKAGDPPFSQSWIDWSDAVALGADYYDGNGNGVYDPVDLNGNGQWDADEDMPDLVGDETVWCVYNDALPQNQRRWNTVAPLGIEVRQTVFAFAAQGPIGNIVFVRYRLKYVGFGNAGEPNQLTDAYFGLFADPDLGVYTDDRIGCDTIRNVGYVYNGSADIGEDGYGATPPSFFIDFFSGPVAYIPGVTYTDNNGNNVFDEGVDTPLDSATNVRGKIKGIKYFPGAKNLGISSFIQYINGDQVINDPNTAAEARFYMLGIPRTGTPLDPCTWTYSSVFGVPCADVDKRFWYSGDPVKNTGWVETLPSDARMMQNSGPFVMNKNEETEVVVAYVIGQGTSPLNSITVARQIDEGAQRIFDNNFVAPTPPPTPVVEVTSGDNYIDLTWSTNKQVGFSDAAYNNYFKGFNIYAYQTNSTTASINNQPNKKLYTTFQLSNFIKDLYVQNGSTGGIELLYPQTDSLHLLDSALYINPQTGKIRLRITQDPFTGTDLVKGKPYYFSITGYAVNYGSLVNRDNPNAAVGTPGDYYLNSSGFVQTVENIENIINYKNKSGIYVGEDIYSADNVIAPLNHPAGAATGIVQYDVLKAGLIKPNEYKVTFFQDKSTPLYSTFWRLTNNTTGQVLIDSSKQYLYNTDMVASTSVDGIIIRAQQQTTTLGAPVYTGTRWFKNFSAARGTGAFYVGTDIPQAAAYNPFGSNARSSLISANKLRRVEIRFGANGKAYRYLNGYVGSVITRRSSYVYAGGVAASDTTGKGAVGKLGEGYVDVPFTAWVVDERYGEEKQLAVGFVEKSPLIGGNPDGTWNPSDSLLLSGEAIVVFDADYSATGGQVQYTGNSSGWADLIKGFTLSDPSATPQQVATAKSPWFNTMYVVGLEKQSAGSIYAAGDKLTLPMTVYPYTDKDMYVFTPSVVTEEEQADLFNKVNVFPNPLFGFNPATSYTGAGVDEAFVTFNNLPEEITIKIFTLSGNLLKTLSTSDKSSPSSPFINWNLQNESGLRVASGLYLAIVSSPKYGDKVLKFSIIMPQKQILRY